MAASSYHVKGVENHILDKIAFLGTYVCTNNPYWQSSGIIIFCANTIQLSSIQWLALGWFFLVARCNIIRASWETKKERSSYRKRHIEKFVWGT